MDTNFFDLINKGYQYNLCENSLERGYILPKMTSKLLPHQLIGMKWMKNHIHNENIKNGKGIGFILADDMGLGKTVQILSHVIDTFKTNTNNNTLVIVPKSIIDQWYNECIKHTNLTKKDICIYYGPKRYLVDCFITLTTSQTLVNDLNKKYNTLFTKKWKRVIIDESSNIRNKKTKFSKSVMLLNYTYGICLSGTPINNTVKDLYPQLDFCRIPRPAFMSRYGRSDWLGSAMYCNQTQLEKWREKYILRRTKAILNIPSPVHHNIDLIMNENELLSYKTALEKARSNFFHWSASNNRNLEEYSKVLLQILRMRQSCNHSDLSEMSYIKKADKSNACIYCGNFGDFIVNVNCCDKHILCKSCLPQKPKNCWFCDINPIKSSNNVSTKINRLFEIISHIPQNEKCVIFSQWNSMLDIMSSKAKSLSYSFSRLDGTMTLNAQENQIKDFRHKNRLFFVSLKAGGLGLNLTEANHVFLVDPWWNPFIEQQAIDRIHRMGQYKTVHIYRFYMKYTIEEWMINLKLHKLDKSNLVIGKCEFNMGQTKVVTKGEIDGLFNFVTSYLPTLISHVNNSQ